MLRVFLPYTDWEAFHAGLFNLTFTGSDVDNSAELLKNPELLREQMEESTYAWPNSSLHNLTNESQNRQAWLGQAACCLHHGASEDATKAAWRTLTIEEQTLANQVADEVILKWEGEYANAKTLFGI